MGYPVERKEAVLRKMLPPNNEAIAKISKDEGISVGTLYSWREQARSQGRLMPDSDNSPNGWTSRDKFAAVMETSAMNESEIAAYCREKGIFAEQLEQWREACVQANDWSQASEKELKAATKKDRKKVAELERELARKEKALAEAAALLVLRKKYNALFSEDHEDDQ